MSAYNIHLRVEISIAAMQQILVLTMFPVSIWRMYTLPTNVYSDLQYIIAMCLCTY